MMVLVTGADGMLGAHICRELLARNLEVRALVEAGRRVPTLDGLALERVEGDILDEASLETATAGCRAVIHAAASTQVWPPRSKRIWALNYEAVRILADVVLKRGIGKLVHIGTANSFGPGSLERPGTENNPYTAFEYKLDYMDSKRAAQDHLIERHRSHGLPVTVVAPSFMFGAYDSKPGSGDMILALHRGGVSGFTRGGRSYVAARDVAVAAVNAIERGRDGECYLAAGFNLGYREAFRLIAETIGVPAPSRSLAPVLVKAAGALGSFSGAVFGARPFLSISLAKQALADFYYLNAKAVRELGLPQTPIGDAIRECYEWMKANGIVDEKRIL